MNLDDQLRTAAQDVRAEIGDAQPPPFTPPSTAGPRLAVAAAAVMLAGGAWWLVRADVADGPVVDAVADSTPVGQDPGLTGFDPFPLSPMNQPSVGEYSVEPNTGVAIRRLTSSSDGSVQQPVFSRTQTHNADGSLLLLYRTRDASAETTHVVVDAATGALVATPDLSLATDIENISWDATDPDRLLFVSGSDVRSLDVRTGVTDTAVSTSCAAVRHGDAAGSTTSGTSKLGLLCEQNDGTSVWAVADLADGSVITGAAAAVDAAPIPMISESGFVVVGDDEVVVLDSELQVVRTVAIEASAFTVAQEADGSDVLVATVFGGPTEPGTAVVVDLASGAVRVVIGPETGAPYPPSGTQLSTAALDAPNLIAISTFSDQTGPLTNEVMVLELDGVDSELRRLAQHRATDERTDGWPPTPTVAISPDGTSVIFSSNWGGSEIDTYEVALGR